MAGERYHTTAPHYMEDGTYIPTDTDIGEGTAYPLPDDWMPSLEVFPLNPAAQLKIRNTPAVNVRKVDQDGFMLPTMKSDPSLDPPDAGKPKDPASPSDTPKPKDTSAATVVDTPPKGK